MVPYRHWRRRRRHAVAEIIGAILLVALTLVAGVILWTFHLNLPSSPPTVGFVIRSGSSNPVWGDPTDCQPQGTWTYPLTTAQQAEWEDGWNGQCYPPYTTGNFSLMNTSQVIVASHSPLNIPLDDIEFQFVCYNSTTTGGTTILVQGSLASMSWFPGSSTTPAADAPNLGSCGNFDAGGFGGGSYGTLYNRLGMFIPIDAATDDVLENGDTFLLYIHNGGWPIDFECVTNEYGCLDCPAHGTCPPGYSAGLPEADWDDYHGAPPWCFTTPGACVIYLTYTGTPTTLLATIPVYLLAPPTGES
jgi:hypothetical protein